LTEIKPSKSAKKREYLALQKLGEELLTIKESDLLAMGLDDELHEAILEARRIKSHGALRRQKQFIGKLMRGIDPEPIRAALQRMRR
jgi:ribosome-associated protein